MLTPKLYLLTQTQRVKSTIVSSAGGRTFWAHKQKKHAHHPGYMVLLFCSKFHLYPSAGSYAGCFSCLSLTCPIFIYFFTHYSPSFKDDEIKGALKSDRSAFINTWSLHITLSLSFIHIHLLALVYFIYKRNIMHITKLLN